MAKSDDAWKQRTLCSDGNCIGIIGADGHCKICGLPYDGDLPSPMAESPMEDDEMSDSPAEQPMTVEVEDGDDDPMISSQEYDDDWENRTLCIDESCIGVVGPDGRCKVCKKPYHG